ncbi:hypothetical protein [Rhodobacteraceae bacterium DSL-40]|uniref:hypothetical protein n=1 Tax=Amaricoccus sp. B4 TaxID=3368557 RepID=UPI000DAC62E8
MGAATPSDSREVKATAAYWLDREKEAASANVALAEGRVSEAEKALRAARAELTAAKTMRRPEPSDIRTARRKIEAAEEHLYDASEAAEAAARHAIRVNEAADGAEQSGAEALEVHAKLVAATAAFNAMLVRDARPTFLALMGAVQEALALPGGAPQIGADDKAAMPAKHIIIGESSVDPGVWLRLAEAPDEVRGDLERHIEVVGGVENFLVGADALVMRAVKRAVDQHVRAAELAALEGEAE